MEPDDGGQQRHHVPTPSDKSKRPERNSESGQYDRHRESRLPWLT
jgi:hypothetical protein